MRLGIERNVIFNLVKWVLNVASNLNGSKFDYIGIILFINILLLNMGNACVNIHSLQ